MSVPLTTALRRELLRILQRTAGVDPSCVFDREVPLTMIPAYPALWFTVNGRKQWNRAAGFSNQYLVNVGIEIVMWVQATDSVLTDEANDALAMAAYKAISADLVAGTMKANLFAATNPGAEANLQHIRPVRETGFSIHPEKTELGWCRMNWTAEIRHSEYNL